MSNVEARHIFECQLQPNGSYTQILVKLTVFYEVLKDAHDLLTAYVTSSLSKRQGHESFTWKKKIYLHLVLMKSLSHAQSKCPKN